MRIIPALLLFSLTTAYAEPLVVHSAINNGKTPSTPKLPFVQSSNAATADRINKMLIGDFKPALSSDGKYYLPTEYSVGNDDSRRNYEIIRNDGRVLTIEFDNEYCGAYCEEGKSYVSFDANTGRHLFMAGIFTRKGLDALAERLATSRLTKIKETISFYKKSDTKENPRSGDEAETIISMYEECAKFHVTNRRDVGHYLQYEKMLIGVSGITFTHDRCSPHVIRALDDLGEFVDSFSFKTLESYLNPYGKKLLLGDSRTASSELAPFFQILRGSLGGKIPITVFLELHLGWDNNYVSGFYYYDKYKTPIALSGTLQGNTLVLNEDSKDDPKPKITATIEGDKLKGHWQGKQRFEIEAAP